MRLTLLSLENFQVHSLQRIAFSPTITTFCGSSDAGKSAILRAIRYACLNDLTGAGFVSHGEKECTVCLHTTAGVIIRTRGSNTNAYQLDVKEFAAFGTTVPPDIANALNVSEINFQGQFDSPFWLGIKNGAEVSRQLNAVIDLSVIDTALASVGKTVSTALERERLCKERLVEAQAKLNDLEPQRQRVADFARLKKVKENYEILVENHGALAGILERAGACQVGDLRARADDSESVLQSASLLIKMQQSIEKLLELTSESDKLQLAATPPPSLGQLNHTFEIWQQDEQAVDELSYLVLQVGYRAEAVTTCKQESLEAEETLHQKTKGKVCPLCERPQ